MFREINQVFSYFRLLLDLKYVSIIEKQPIDSERVSAKKWERPLKKR